MFVQQALETRSTAHKEVLGNCPYLKLHCARNRCAQRRRYRPFLVTAHLKHTFSGSPCRRSSRWYARAIASEGTATFCLKFASHTQRATAALQRYLTACCLICLSCLLSGSFRRSKQVLRWPRIEQCHHIERLDVGAFPLCLERKSKAVCDLFAVVGNNVHAQDQSNHATCEARVVQVVLLATQLRLAPANVLADCLPVHGQTASTRLRRSPIPPRSRYPLPSPYRLRKWITRAVAVEFTLATRLFSPSSTTPRSSLITLHKTAPGGTTSRS